jgi:hypothetical protein
VNRRVNDSLRWKRRFNHLARVFAMVGQNGKNLVYYIAKFYVTKQENKMLLPMNND